MHVPVTDTAPHRKSKVPPEGAFTLLLLLLPTRVFRLNFGILKKFSAMYSKKCMIPSSRRPYSLHSIREAIPLHWPIHLANQLAGKGHRPSWHELELAPLSHPHWLPRLVALQIAPFSMRMGLCQCHDARYARDGQDTHSLAQSSQLILVARWGYGSRRAQDQLPTIGTPFLSQEPLSTFGFGKKTTPK